MSHHSLNEIEYSDVPEHYLQQRELKKGSIGWVLLASLGVSYVISGDFAGWNFGIAAGGFGGFLIAAVAMATLYSCMVLSLAELSAALPTAGGGYSYARRALGPWGGYLTGTAILLEYAVAPAAIAIFIGDYIFSLTGYNSPLLYAAAYGLFIGIHLWGVGEAFKLMMIITLFAVFAILIFSCALIPYFSWDRLFDITPNVEALGHSTWLPQGWMGIWAALPFAMWLFLAVEGVPLAAEESRNPSKDMPRGIIAAMVLLIAFAALVTFLSAGALGAEALKSATAPLVQALTNIYGEASWLPKWVNAIGLLGLIASFFSIIYAYSRQVFALSRAGYFPKFLSITNRRKSPHYALIIPGMIGFALSLTGEGDLLITVAVFGATLSYILMMISHIRLRQQAPELPRPYKTPGGTLTSGIALLLSIVAFLSTFIINLEAALITGVAYTLFAAYFGFYSRFHLVAQAPEEEFATILQAEKDLNFEDRKVS
jgi:ethanolamine permease